MIGKENSAMDMGTKLKKKLKKPGIAACIADGKSMIATPPQRGKKRKSVEIAESDSSSTLHMSDLLSDADSPKLKPRRKSKSGNESWEKAVMQARGVPDGASALHSSAESGKLGESGKAEKVEKAKINALHVVQGAADKLKKKLTGKEGAKKGPKKQTADSPRKKGVKRKHSGDTEEKGTNLDSLAFKDRKKQRKMMRDTYELSHGAKTIWEQLRRHSLSAEKKHELCGELLDIIKDHIKELIFAHDTSRVVQCLMKYGTADHRTVLFEELREHIVEMTKSKYAKFFVRKLLKYGTKKQRDYVFRALYGNVRKLMRHKEAAEVVECAYNDFANAVQRASLIEEFYGPSFALFKTADAHTLDQIMQSSPEKRDSILSNMKEALAITVEKSICQYSIIHKVFMEYFTYATEKHRTEMIETVRESVIHMLHTRDGAHVAMNCVWFGTAKDRKVIIKSMKTYVVKVCKEEYGHLVILALADSVDDTKLLSKVVLEEMLKKVDEVAEDQYGRKVLLYLLEPRSPVHFHPDIVKILKKGDGNVHSKKDVSIRRQELLEMVSASLLKYVCGHARELVLSNSLFLLLMSIITHAKGDTSAAMRAVCEVAAEPFVTGHKDFLHMVEHPAGHLALKRLILNDQHRVQEGSTSLFSCVLLETLKPGKLKEWAACNRGCFILVSLMEVPALEVNTRVKKELTGIQESLSRMEFKGAEILLQKLKK